MHIFLYSTYPTLNILVYNLLSSSTGGGSGDILYGTEPILYYIKNLLLTTGIAGPLALLCLPMLFIEFSMHIIHKKFTPKMVVYRMVIIRSVVLWMVVLFLRLVEVYVYVCIIHYMHVYVLFVVYCVCIIHCTCLLYIHSMLSKYLTMQYICITYYTAL